MTTSSNLTFRLNFILLMLAILLVVAGGSLGMVGLRMQIESTAQEAKALELEIADLENLDRFLDARMARIHQPKELVHLVAERGLNLRPPSPQQFVHVRETLPNALFSESSRVADRRYDRRNLSSIHYSALSNP